MISNSWVIINKDTQLGVHETYNESSLKHLRDEFQAIPTHEYLFYINRRIKDDYMNFWDTVAGHRFTGHTLPRLIDALEEQNSYQKELIDLSKRQVELLEELVKRGKPTHKPLDRGPE